MKIKAEKIVFKDTFCFLTDSARDISKVSDVM